MSENQQVKVAVLGTGAWGTVFAKQMCEKGHDVVIWGRNPRTVEQINSGINERYLPGVELPVTLHASTDLNVVVPGRKVIFVVIPVAAVRETLQQVAPLLDPYAVIVLLCKGLENGSQKTVHDVCMEATGLEPARIAVLSGPNLSGEISAGQPTATVIASTNKDTASWLADICHTETLRPYVSTDVIGCEIAGATKNVIALAIGAAHGLGLGHNTRATLITRGLAEMARLGIALGASPDTFLGLAGVGDLIATCSSTSSRNFSFGVRLGQGMSVADAFEASAGVVEGARTATPILQLAQSIGVDMPIVASVCEVVEGRATIHDMGRALLARPRKMDGWKINLV